MANLKGSSSIHRIVALTLALSSPAAAADKFGCGTYTCVTQRLVGLLGRPGGLLRPETDKFLLIIEKIKREPWMCDPTQERTSELRTYDWWWRCGAINQAVLSKEKTGALNEFRSDDLNVFRGELGNDSFWLTNDGSYTLVYLIQYLEEGTCRRMK